MENLENENPNAPLASNRKLILGGAGVFSLCLIAWATWSAYAADPRATDTASPISSANASIKTPQEDVRIAKVNGVEITELEIAGLLQSGIDRAIVVDRYINKVLAAELGRKTYVDEAEAALRAAEREVLSTLYTTKRLDEIRAKISEEEVKNYYDNNVRDSDFQLWKVSYYLSTSTEEAGAVIDKLRKGDKDAQQQLRGLVDQGDGFAVASALPYNLGRVVSKMKKGEISEVLPLRNGFLILKIDDTRQLKKPSLDEARQEIVQVLSMQKFNAELESARKTAKVELG